jgi:LysM repeat protein
MKYGILLIIGFLSYIKTFAVEQDSIGLVQKNGQWVIIYEVGPKETIYSIARKYNIPPKSIMAINPEVMNEGLKIGQKIFVPIETARQKNPVNEITFAKDNIDNAIYHVVEKGQTLFAIAKQYNTPVYNIKQWNKLNSNDVKIGTKLIVGFNQEQEVGKDEVVYTKETIKSNTGFEKTIERGYYTSFKTSKEQEGYYLVKHKYLPEGTIVRLVNESNGAFLFAKVIDKLESQDKNLIALVSNNVIEKLSLTRESNFILEYIYP